MNLTIKIYQIREGKNKKTRNVVLVVLSFLGLKNRQLTILKHSSQKKKKKIPLFLLLHNIVHN